MKWMVAFSIASALTVSGHAQSLADVAKQTEAERSGQAPAKRTLTNKDLPAARTLPSTDNALAPTDSGKSITDPTGEPYWRERRRTFDAKLSADQAAGNEAAVHYDITTLADQLFEDARKAGVPEAWVQPPLKDQLTESEKLDAQDALHKESRDAKLDREIARLRGRAALKQLQTTYREFRQFVADQGSEFNRFNCGSVDLRLRQGDTCYDRAAKLRITYPAELERQRKAIWDLAVELKLDAKEETR